MCYMLLISSINTFLNVILQNITKSLKAKFTIVCVFRPDCIFVSLAMRVFLKLARLKKVFINLILYVYPENYTNTNKIAT